jgi:hypothetical protein
MAATFIVCVAAAKKEGMANNPVVQSHGPCNKILPLLGQKVLQLSLIHQQSGSARRSRQSLSIPTF